MSTQLIVCPDCARHVREGAAACPFCAAPTAALTATRATLATALVVAAGLGMQACYGGPPRPRTYTSAHGRPGGAVMQVASDPTPASDTAP